MKSTSSPPATDFRLTVTIWAEDREHIGIVFRPELMDSNLVRFFSKVNSERLLGDQSDSLVARRIIIGPDRWK
jgi:hypothetical protein